MYPFLQTLQDENTNSDSTVVPILVGAPGSRDWEGTEDDIIVIMNYRNN